MIFHLSTTSFCMLMHFLVLFQKHCLTKSNMISLYLCKYKTDSGCSSFFDLIKYFYSRAEAILERSLEIGSGLPRPFDALEWTSFSYSPHESRIFGHIYEM